MKRFAIAFALLFLCPILAHASEPVYLSEVAWAGSSASTADEWFELCGPPGTDLSGWKVDGAAANGLVLPSDSVIPASGAFLVSNYSADDPKSTLAVAPNFVTTAVALSNSNLFLALRDPSGTIIDIDGASGSAPLAGTSGSVKTSMARLLPLLPGDAKGAWTSSSGSVGFDPGAPELGSPGVCPTLAEIAPTAPISSASETSAETIPDASATETAVVVETQAPIAPPLPPISAVRISEAYPWPNAGEHEWIELVDPSSVGEVLDGWTIEDGKGTATPLSGTMLPWGRLVIASPKGQLNNDGDLIVLKDPQGRVIDGVAYGAWDTALYPRVGDVGKGEALMRLELQDTFDVTTTPTPGAANVLTRKVTAAVIPSAAEETLAKHASQAVPPLAALGRNDGAGTVDRNDVKKEATTIKKNLAKKTVVSKYKGVFMTAVIASPPGVYAKTRFYVLRKNDVQEVRLSKNPSAKFATGQRIAFIGSAKEDGDASSLSVNPNSIRFLDRSATATFATTEAWPDAAGPYRFEAEVVSLSRGTLAVRLGGVEGEVLLPSPAPAFKTGDLVAIEGFVAPGTKPRVVLPNAASVTLVKAASIPQTSGAATHLSWPFMGALTAAAILFGLLAHVRNERLKRLSLIAQPIEE